MAPNETAENMAHLRRTYDPKSLENDRQSPPHSPDTRTCLQSLDTHQKNHRKRTSRNSSSEEQSHSKDAADQEAKLINSGIKAAVICVFLYLYGNHMVLGYMKKDSRVDNYYPWIYSSPTPTLLISLAYIAGVTFVGPRLMRGRQPPKWLKQIMILYNAFQVVFCTVMFIEAGLAGWFGSYSFICQPCDFSNNYPAIRMLKVAIYYHFTKFLDFFDTFFFVLNHKYSHISLLHVTHHAMMPIGLWYGIRHEPGGQTTFFGFLNGFIHIVMYMYYLLAALGPRVRPYLWWKRYLTRMQMAQFITMFIHALQSLVFGCPAGRPLMKIIMVMAAIFQILFTDFYIKAYRKRASKAQGSKTNIPMMCTIDDKTSSSSEESRGEEQTLRSRAQAAS